LVQHDRGRHLTAAILTGATDDLSEASTRAAMQNYLAAFVRMYEPHEAWEDTVIYPALRAVTTQRTLDQLAEQFADEENRQYGAQALVQVLDRVTGVEEQLGIGDLNSFTPPAVSGG
jgi:hemerythrin-like domain-containing protein